MKVVFMGTPDFAVETLKAIAGAGHDIAAVVTQPDKPRGRSGALMFSAVKEEAVNLGIECILQPEKARDEAFIQQIRDINPDVIVVVAYGKILPKSLLDIPKYGCINVHASLLPKYRGAAPIQWSVINGDEYSGVTTMFMGEGLDTGDILLQKSIKLDKKETGGSLFDKLSVIGAELLVETLVELKNGTVKRIPQDESQATQVTVFDKSFGKIDFNKGLIRYASDRFLEIELVTNNVTGLKIPLSSIVTKEFYAIPSKYLTTDDETQQSGFMLSGRNKKGDSTTTFVSAGIYGRDEITDKETQETSYIYYVDKNKFKEGDALVEPDSGEKFIIGDTEVLEGVFCVNQGYAVFRRIEILDENEEYAVVSKETYNGLVRYDRIVKNADKVSEQDILY